MPELLDAVVPSARDIVISGENVHKTYLLGVEGVAALRGVNVDVIRGELLLVYGTSGGGKSTLLNVLGTIDAPTKGNLSIFDERISDRTPDALLASIRNRKIGFVFQSFNLLSTMSALDNVALPMVIAGQKSASEISARARQLLCDVGLGHRVDHLPSMLSGGEQQRVTIARALANEPEILLLDEPTGDLDTVNTHLVLNTLLQLNRDKNLTMVMVTHDVYMKQYAHRVIYLRDGKVSRVEAVPSAVRSAAIDVLERQVTEDQARIAEMKVLGGASNASNTVGLTGMEGRRVVVRRPSDYPTYTPHATGDAFRNNPQMRQFLRLFPRPVATDAAADEVEMRGIP